MLYGLHATGKAHSSSYCALAKLNDAALFEVTTHDGLPFLQDGPATSGDVGPM
jgi:hypothetical protein